ncbi:hypothetical protein CTI12_AA364990 [Artemisia annua]|uniref:Splicing factor 3B subunit 1 n=1 Tax=Artemisia annua TaxID=35608 RepID=A0A2U1MM35_ARTAN|nr:hypothetical protein CTI12_AA364990 [Artemisia annua]
METIEKVVANLGASDIDPRLEELLIDGEEYPEVLGSILGALKAIVNVIGMTKMTPPIKGLLPRLTPILKNRHDYVPAREWMRICFELLEMLKAHKKVIRQAAVNTFGENHWLTVLSSVGMII